jgi:hypothetical protein
MAAPETQKTDQAPKENAPASGSPAPTPGRPPAPKRGGGGILARLLLSAILLLVVLGIAGYGALIYRDSDPRIGVAAGYVDQGVAEAQNAVGKAQNMIADLTGSGAPKPAAEPEKPTAAPAEPEPPQTAAATPAPAAPAAPTWEMPKAKEPEKPAETKAATPAPEKPVEEAKPVEPVKPIETAKPAEAAKPAEPEKPAEAVKAPEPVPAPAPVVAAPAAPAPATEFRDADGFTAHDLIAALEGRIEALNDEVQALRQKLDAPKNETRAAPEAVEAQKAQNAPTGAVADVTGAEIALAFALQRDLDAGRPFTAEIAGFNRLGTSPAPGPALVEFAETGAPTAAKLHEEFEAIARKLRAHESHAAANDAGAIADHILEGASKLVKVRPTTGAAEPESFHGKLDRIEHALAHGDFATAESLFDSLPDSAREEAEAFGKSLHQRRAAARAAEELLNSAIAALGKK